jgi:hypothetical protein
MKPLSLVGGFAPLIIFGALSGRVADNGAAWAAVVAGAAAVVASYLERPRRPVRIVNVVQFGLLAAVAVAGFVGPAAVDRWLFEWGAGVITLVTGLAMIALVPVVAFTEQYARASTPPAYWGSPTFKSINRVLSLAWGGAIAVLGSCSLLAGALHARATDLSSVHAADLALNWVVPIVVLWAMIKFTAHYPDRVTGRAADPAVPPVPAGPNPSSAQFPAPTGGRISS